MCYTSEMAIHFSSTPSLYRLFEDEGAGNIVRKAQTFDSRDVQQTLIVMAEQGQWIGLQALIVLAQPETLLRIFRAAVVANNIDAARLVWGRLGPGNNAFLGLLTMAQGRHNREEMIDTLLNHTPWIKHSYLLRATEAAVGADNIGGFTALAKRLDLDEVARQFSVAAHKGRTKLMAHMFPVVQHSQEFPQQAKRAMRLMACEFGRCSSEEAADIRLALCPWMTKQDIADIIDQLQADRSWYGASIGRKAVERLQETWSEHERQWMTQQVGDGVGVDSKQRRL